MKTYVGQHDKRQGVWEVKIHDDKTNRTYSLPLEPSLKIANHSPTGFSWGYGGSGPAQLSLAILLDVFGDETIARENYQQFKWNVIAKVNQEAGFQISEQQVRETIQKIERTAD